MKLVYIISAYKNPEQLVRLVQRLNTSEAFFFVHVDRKTDRRVYSQIVAGLNHLPNVFFLRRHVCHWGDFGHVKASLKGIAEVASRNIPFDYAILLTGQDYPIKPNAYIETFLEESAGRSFIDYFPLPAQHWQPDGGLDSIQAWHFRIGQRKYRFPAEPSASRSSSRGWMGLNALLPWRKFPPGFQPYGGSSYWCLSRESIEYIYRFTQANPAFVRFFKYVEVPDEIFFQTILLNSPLRDRMVNDDLRYIDWKDPDATSPAVLDERDFPKMARSPKLFARKFEPAEGKRICDMIDQYLLNSTALPASNRA